MNRSTQVDKDIVGGLPEDSVIRFMLLLLSHQCQVLFCLETKLSDEDTALCVIRKIAAVILSGLFASLAVSLAATWLWMWPII